MKPSEIIDKALTEFIPDESKWTKRTRVRQLLGGEQQYCLLGALSMAHHGTAYVLDNLHSVDSLAPEEERVRKIIADIIMAETGGSTIWWYNDHEDRTYDEVRAVLEKARAGLEEQGL